MYDVAVVGGGPAGLSAAMTLGRARRSTLLVDSGEPRNELTSGVHNFLTRDGLAPAEVRRLGRRQLATYDAVELRDAKVSDARTIDGGFELRVDGESVEARRLLLATGLVDEPPGIPGARELWGRAIFHCLYCDGYEARDKPLAALGATAADALLALSLAPLASEVALCTNGADVLDDDTQRQLDACGIAVHAERIERLEPTEPLGVRVLFTDGQPLERRALFVRARTHQRSVLAPRLGCRQFDDGSVEVDDFSRTSVPGVYAAGDMARRAAFPFATAQIVLAASAGVIAGVVIDKELRALDLQTITTG